MVPIGRASREDNGSDAEEECARLVHKNAIQNPSAPNAESGAGLLVVAIVGLACLVIGLVCGTALGMSYNKQSPSAVPGTSAALAAGPVPLSVTCKCPEPNVACTCPACPAALLPTSPLAAEAPSPPSPPASPSTALSPPSRSSSTSSAIFPSLPIPCRDDLAIVAQRYFATHGGIAAEIGVNRGVFSAKNLKHWLGTYWMIDAWSYRPGDPGDKNYKDNSINDANYNQAMQVTSFAGERRHLLRALSVPSAAQFKDDFFDWVYIDALHTKKAMLADLTAWYPKVRPGGLISGDDYGDKDNTELCTADRWAKQFTALNKNPDFQWGVISAVNEFTRPRGIQVHVTWMADCYKWMAWYFVKPS